jgi:hypothetical protein
VAAGLSVAAAKTGERWLSAVGFVVFLGCVAAFSRSRRKRR